MQRTLEALRAQTLQKDQWELLLIDNASKAVLSKNWDLSWHPYSKQIREDQLGLVNARLRGIFESIGDTLIFVDDDNVLQSDYLYQALLISKDWPMIGAWAGNIEGEFEEAPRPEISSLLPLLAIRNIKSIKWSNGGPNQNHAIPVGAGMCIRKHIAVVYSRVTANNPNRKMLDRQGATLASSGDTDLALTACDQGLGTGLFPQLSLIHLIPTKRVDIGYLIKLYEEVEFGHLLLYFLRGQRSDKPTVTSRVLTWYGILRSQGIQRQKLLAHKRARDRFLRIVRG